jgi:hypothetical protein
MGRESRDEFGESLAPEKGDAMTMEIPSSGIQSKWKICPIPIRKNPGM